MTTAVPVDAGTPVVPTAIDNSRVWLLAAAPLLLFAVAAGFLYSGRSESTGVAIGIALAVNIGLAVWDSRYLRARGVHMPQSGAWFIPGYLWTRSRKLDASSGPLAVWLAAFALSVVGTVVVDSHFTAVDRVVLQGDIGHWVTQNGGGSDPVVTCPSRQVYAVHDTFVCAISGASVSNVLVTVQNRSGDVTWTAIG